MGLMQIPRRVDYGLRAVIYLSVQDPERCCSITEIATQQGVPKKFLEKIIQDLIRGGLIKSKRGACGGYTLARSPEEISFYEVIEALEHANRDGRGTVVVNGRLIESHHVQAAKRLLALADMIEKLEAGQ